MVWFLLVLLALAAFDNGPAGVAAAQTPGSAWALAPAPDRTVKMLYWQLFDRTEIWTRLSPKGISGSQLPFNLIFSATFDGNLRARTTAKPRNAQPEITMVAQPHPLAVLPIPNLSFAFWTDYGEPFDLIANGKGSRVLSLSEPCCSDAIVAQIDKELLRALTRSTSVSGRILGFECVLDRDDINAISEFARVVLRY